MAILPINDQLKVKVDNTDEFGFGTEKKGVETGVVVVVPDIMIYLGFHSFSFEDSFVNEDKLKIIQQYYSKLLNKRVWWESFQDRGRRMKEDDGDYVYLKMTDIMCYSDDIETKAEMVEDSRAGSFAV